MKETFEKLYDGSYYTIMGCGGDIQDWVNGYIELLQQHEIGTPTDFTEFTGGDMNRVYNLTGDNRYPEDLKCLAFSLDGLNVGKLAMVKIQMGDRWFDDIVDNNSNREA